VPDLALRVAPRLAVGFQRQAAGRAGRVYTGHRRCGELDDGVDGPTVWIVCVRGATVTRRGDEGPWPAATERDDRGRGTGFSSFASEGEGTIEILGLRVAFQYEGSIVRLNFGQYRHMIELVASTVEGGPAQYLR
jgi:hypothetical protein